MKPEYSIPTMRQIERLPWNGYNVVSTFSGAGGSCLGYRMAGYRVLYAVEFVPAAQDTYKANHPNSYLDTRDVRLIDPKDILEKTDLDVGQIDLFDGSPPCASFSTSGTRDAGWGKVKKYSDVQQRVDDLFFEYVRLIKGLQPKTFVAENVSGLVKGKAKGYFKIILAALKECGYNVSCRVLDAQWLGVPQQRQRTIFVGVRKDLKLKPAHPEPLSYQHTVREILPWVIREQRGGFPDNWQPTTRPASTIVQSGSKVSPTAYLSGGTYIEAQTPSGVLERRMYNIPELRKICSFPEDFVLTGDFHQQWERLGRSVPPVMMSHIGKTIQRQVLDLL